MPKEFAGGETNVQSSTTSLSQQNASNSSSISANSSSSGEYFEFKTIKARAIFDYLAKAFTLDYMTKRYARDDSGWRSLGNVARDMHISTSVVYAKKKNELSPPVQELFQRGFVEQRYFQRERGRGGEVMRLRIAYENDVIKDYFEQKVRGGPSRMVTTNATAIAKMKGSDAIEKTTDEKLDKLRIAVLPFLNISQDPKDEYFTDGMTEELISTISKIGGLKVIARTSVLRYKNASKGIDEIGKELRVGTVLEGSVRKAGEKLRITAQLIDPITSQHLWSESYDRELKDVFAIQSEISQTVANTLKIKLLESERKRIEEKPTESTKAHLLYMKGLYYELNELTVAGQNKAIAYFGKSIEIDPQYSLAFAGMSDCYDTLQYLAEQGQTSEISKKEALSKSEDLARRALDIDPNLAEGHASLSQVKLRKREWEGAESEAKTALELNPNLVTGHLTYCLALSIRGRLDQAVEESRKAIELDPFSPFANYTFAHYLHVARQYGRAEEQARKMIDLDLEKIHAHVVLGEIYYAKSLFKESLEEFQQILDPSKGKADVHLAEIARCYTKLGRTEEARKILEDLVEISKDQYIPGEYVFPLYLALDEKDKAFEYLEKIGEGDMVVFSLHLKYSPLFDDVRSDPRFTAILKKLGL